MVDRDQSALELQALQRVIASGTRALELDVVLDRCLEQALEVARADAGTIYLTDPKRGRYRLAASRNTSTEFTPGTLEVVQRIKGRHALFDLAADAKLPPASATAVKFGFSHALVIILTVEERRVGFLGLLFKGAPALAESTLGTLEAIAGFEAVALESARVHQQVELRARLARTLNECAGRLLESDADVPALILDAACKIARADRAFVSSMFERDGEPWARIVHAIGKDMPLVGMALPTTAPYIKEALGQTMPMVVEDIGALDPTSVVGRVAREQGTSAFILVTMRQRDRPLGQLFAASGEPRTYDDAEIDAMQLLASLAAQALTRAAQQAEERAEHARIAAILEHLPVVVAVIDVTGRLVHINAAGRDFAQRMGSESIDWREALSSIQVFDRDGRTVPSEETGVVRAFAGETTARELTLVTRLGERLHVLSVSVPLRGPQQQVEAVLSSFQEVTALRELADAKDRFLSIASHELRSPITSLRATTSLLQLDPNAITDESRRTVLLSRIQRQIDRLSTLVERLLDTTRLNTGELPLDYADCDLAALCDDAVEHARLTDREHEYVLDAPPPLPGHWDPARIEQVLTNLISNACRYSPSKSTITVRARAAPDAEHVSVDVIDEGPGIPPELQDKLFTPFFRGPAAARYKSGLGLGLYITREIVRRHGGALSIQSVPGHGATFHVELPQRPH